MSRTVMRLAPSQAGGRLLSGTVLLSGGGAFSAVAIGVPCSLIVGPAKPAVIVPQSEGAMPGSGVIVQQVTRPLIKKKPPIATRATKPQKMSCPTLGRPSLMFLSDFILFIEVLYIPYPGRGAPGPPVPSVVV